MPQLHDYPVSVAWSGGRDGKGTVSGGHSGTSINIAVPPEFQGPGGGSSPEELLTSAIASCYAMTLGIIAANRKLAIRDLRVEAVGQVEQNGPSFKYISVTIRPTITLQGDAGEDQVALANDVAHKADAYCIVTNSVRASVQISVEPSIEKG